MSTAARISIAGFAGCTPLGYSLAPTLAAMGAGLSNFSDTQLKTPFGTAVMAASLLDRDIPRILRLRGLLALALIDLRELLAAAGVQEAPLMLGVPSDLEGDEKVAIKEEFSSRATFRSEITWFPHGRASAFAALAGAM